ncbi:trypco2 family protein [Streptomyces sp. CBMA123]|uniref:trypco2 family protein n=1 Tax=Streptomyces sp. CBMA123 TaxID=1896313 RepID=UPI001661BED1|nr:trypco2 family protein [Streptomyces sp. CBMA123]MBD0692549.1 hypothetical protein [Streptomyces sp. CBMA123]
MDKPVVGLAAAIEALRAELTAALDKGQDKPMQFRLEPIELTVQASVTKDGGGKIGWSVLGIGASAEAANTQTLTLRLAPMWKTPEGTLTTDFTITSITAGGDTFGPPPKPEPNSEIDQTRTGE